MNSNHSALGATLRILVSLGLLVGAADAALAATSGSTDIYRNEFSSSFGSGTPNLGTSSQSTQTSGSTDIYVNRFERSFGQVETVRHQASNMRWNGSTDLWGNGFHEVFESPGSSVGSTSSAKSAVEGRPELKNP
jgi:hypothetical protein